MRTTLTLDDDVAAALERRRARRGTRLRDEVNELLRAGLGVEEQMQRPSEYVLPSFDSGAQLISDIKAIAEMLDAEDLERGFTSGR